MGIPRAARRLVGLVVRNDERLPRVARTALRRVLPLSLFMSEPVGQVFIADGEVSTFLCVNNFFTLLSPGATIRALVDVVLVGPSGRDILHTTLTMESDGALAIPVDDLLESVNERCPVGLATVQLRPEEPEVALTAHLKDLGPLTSHFFTYYLGADREAMAIIHPQSTINQPPAEDIRWKSSQAIATSGLEGLRLYQANHSYATLSIDYHLRDLVADQLLETASLTLEPSTAAAVDIQLRGAREHEYVFIEVSRLPTPNGKPLIMRRYADESFSMSHG